MQKTIYIILLSILRKILTISLLDKTWEHLEEKIPKTQAAYQRGRGTTEQVLALKLIIEKAIISSDLDIYILLLDMSKAFDTVNRKILLSDLATTLNPDEVHLLGVLTNRPLISIFLDGEVGEGFHSYVGICQGDCLSAVLFIFYLSNALSNNLQNPAAADELKALLDIFYADDLTYVTLTSTSRKDIKEDTPRKLERYNLFVNLGKTEEGEAPDRRPPPPPPPPPDEDPGIAALDWMVPEKKCQLLSPTIKTSNFLEVSSTPRKTSAQERTRYGNQSKSTDTISDPSVSALNTK